MSFLVIDIHAGEFRGYYRTRADADHIASEIRETGRYGAMVAEVQDDDAVHLPPDRIIDRSGLPKPPNAREEVLQRQRAMAEKRQAERSRP